MFQTTVVVKVKTHIFLKILQFMRWCGNFGRARGTRDHNVIQCMHVACCI